MKSITLYQKNNSGITSISNYFIDVYMKDANEAQIKVYIYLLRCSGNAEPVSVSTIADLFNYTERDIIRALEYWDRVGIITIDRDEDKSIRGICLNPIGGTAPKTAQQPAAPAPVKAVAPAHEDAAPSKEVIHKDTKPFYPRERLEKFKAREDVSEMIYIAEKYLGKPLNYSDVNTVLFIYDKLGFKIDLIEYLIDYCVNGGHLSMHYIESTAIAWHEQGIDNVATAKAQTGAFNKDYFSVLHAFGLNGRNPVKNEIDYIRRWKDEFGFDMEIILEAVNRTMRTIARPSFRYADSILSDWKKKNVKGKNDIAKLDADHDKLRDAKVAHPNAQTPQPRKVSNFDERTYDYSALEEKYFKN